MTAWYNEPDKAKGDWLEHLIEDGQIAKGVVDRRLIQEVEAADLIGFTQCHFFAGIGVWSYALRLAGWPDDRPVWTGSCPCGPFSRAGLQKGFEDPRHLWPEWFRIIRLCRPDRILGEQSDAASAWVDLVSDNLEGLAYAFGAVDIPAAGFGGAHIRQRFYWVADADNPERWAEHAPWHDGDWPASRWEQGHGDAGERGDAFGLGIAGSQGLERRDARTLGFECSAAERASCLVRMGHPDPIPGGQGCAVIRRRDSRSDANAWTGLGGSGGVDWLLGRDTAWRPVEPSTSPLAYEAPARVGRLRGYGDAIDAETAAQFIGAYMDALS